MRRIVVIANCHCLPIAKILSLGLSGYSCEFIDVNFLDREPFLSRVHNLIADPADFVFSFPLSARWKGLDMETLRAVYGNKFVTFTNIHFDGLHPDITYIGQMGARVQGFLSDYHSKLILYSYASGRTVIECLDLFNNADYGKIGYLSAFDTAQANLLDRDGECDVKFCNTFIELIRSIPSLYTVNHPADHVFNLLTKTLCDFVGLPFIKYPEQYLTNQLSENVIWPVYDRLAEAHNLPYRTPQTFLTTQSFEGRTTTFAETITRFYSAYQNISLHEFASEIRSLHFYEPLANALD